MLAQLFVEFLPPLLGERRCARLRTVQPAYRTMFSRAVPYQSSAFMEVADVTNRSASFSFVAQSSQQTSTVRPRIVTWIGLLSSSQSQAAQVLIVMIVVS